MFSRSLPTSLHHYYDDSVQRFSAPSVDISTTLLPKDESLPKYLVRDKGHGR